MSETVLLVGGGGREHALARAITDGIADRPDADEYRFVACASNRNPGIAELADDFEVLEETDPEAVAAYATDVGATLAVVAPDDPLAAGVVDALEGAGIYGFGPTQDAARIESDKEFQRRFMREQDVPGCPAFAVFEDTEAACEYLDTDHDTPVLKPAGLTGGKGVRIIGDQLDSEEAKSYLREHEFDHSAARDYEFTWWASQPGRGANFWIPLRVNPEQERLWHDLVNGDASAGQLRLQRHRTTWTLHVTVEFSVEADYEPTDDDLTPVGFDIGEAHLLAGCACEQGTPSSPLLINGGRARHLRKEMFTTLKRLQERDAAEWRIDERFDHYQNALTDIIEKASRGAVEYACQFEKPVIVLEDLSYIREDLDYGKWMNRRLHAWAFARLQERIQNKAREAGLPVRYVRPEYTSQTCHECGHVGDRNGDEFRCTNGDCWVSEYHTDINAAVNIGDRLDPWGESLPLKPAGDDIPRDGSPSDRAATPTEQSPPRQMTLGEIGSEPTSGA